MSGQTRTVTRIAVLALLLLVTVFVFTSTATATGTIANPDFNAGTLTPWQWQSMAGFLTGASNPTTTPLEGAYSGVLCSANSYDPVFYQNGVDFTGINTIRFNYYLFNTGNNPTVELWVCAADNSFPKSNPVDAERVFTTTNGNTVMGTYTWHNTGVTGVHSFVLLLKASSNSNAAWCAVDSFQVNPVDTYTQTFTTKDDETGVLIPSKLYVTVDGVTNQYTSDTGEYSYSFDAAKTYTVVANSTHYQNMSKIVTAQTNGEFTMSRQTYQQIIVTYDDFTVEPIASSITVTNGTTTNSYSSETGQYQVTLQSGKIYQISGTSAGFDPNAQTWGATVYLPGNWALPLIKQYTCTVDISVSENLYGSLVSGAEITLYDTVLDVTTQYTSSNGLMRFGTAIKGHEYDITITKSGYTVYTDTHTWYNSMSYPVVLETQEEPETTENAYLTFKVCDHETLSPIYGAIVTLQDGQTRTTDYNGIATFEVTKGSMGAIIKKDGYYTLHDQLTISYTTIESVTLTKMVDINTGTPTPSAIPDMNTTIQIGFMAGYKENINTTLQAVETGVLNAFEPVTSAFDGIHTILSTISGHLVGEKGIVTGYTQIFDIIGQGIAAIHWKVKAVITYYLVCVLVLLALNR